MKEEVFFMAKINLTKVEGALHEGLEKIRREKLEALTENSNTLGKEKKEMQILLVLVNQLRHLFKENLEDYKAVGMTIKEVEELLKKKEPLNKEVQNRLLHAKKMIKKIKAKNTKESQELVDMERRRHINKRFNVNEKWLPLQ